MTISYDGGGRGGGVTTCPSNRSALPDISGFWSNTQASFKRYLERGVYGV